MSRIIRNSGRPSNKSQSQNTIVLPEGERIVSDDAEVAKTMNEFFVTVADSLGRSENFNDENATDGSQTLLRRR